MSCLVDNFDEVAVDFTLETSEIDVDGDSDLCEVCTRVLGVDDLRSALAIGFDADEDSDLCEVRTRVLGVDDLRSGWVTGSVFESGAVIGFIFDEFADFGFADECLFRISIVVVFVFDKATTFETDAVAVSAFGSSDGLPFVTFDGFGSVEVYGTAEVFIVFDDVGTAVCNDE